jgi:hypothetical protein
MCGLFVRRLRFAILLIAFCLCLIRPALGAGAAASAPWLQPDNADKYIFLGTSVWDIDAGTMVSPTDAPKGVSSQPCVWTAPDHHAMFQNGLKGRVD